MLGFLFFLSRLVFFRKPALRVPGHLRDTFMHSKVLIQHYLNILNDNQMCLLKCFNVKHSKEKKDILIIFQHFQYLKCRTFSLLAESAFFNPFFLEVKDDLRALFDLLTFLLPRSGSLQMSSGG